jgi:hypothetical protein
MHSNSFNSSLFDFTDADSLNLNNHDNDDVIPDAVFCDDPNFIDNLAATVSDGIQEGQDLLAQVQRSNNHHDGDIDNIVMGVDVEWKSESLNKRTRSQATSSSAASSPAASSAASSVGRKKPAKGSLRRRPRRAVIDRS